MHRQEHPKPQFMRTSWENLNGEWQFEQDFSKSGREKKWFETGVSFSQKINVPFCPESELSGINFKDFMPCVWYKRKINVDKAKLDNIVRLHFGACDYQTFVYVNGVEVGQHIGGYVSFFFDIQEYLQEGENEITVCAYDDVRDSSIPKGKQSNLLRSYGCFYTRTTGIWQTVWLEFIPKTHIEKVKYYPNAKTCSIAVNATLVGKGELKATAFFEGEKMGEIAFASTGGHTSFSIPLKEKRLWEIGKGNLYDIFLSYGEDEVQSYFALRDASFVGCKFMLNGKSVFQRLVLDQGFYPDGIYTAPSDEALKKDILLSQAIGFNGARLHEKIFEERFLYHCDKLGYLVWGEFPNWGLSHTLSDVFSVLPEWLEEIDRDFNHPCIVGWCPLNETRGDEGEVSHDKFVRVIYEATKAADPTRPCIDTSGWFHVKTDVYDVHNYEQSSEKLAKSYENLEKGEFTAYNNDERRKKACYRKGMPFFVSEYGGIAWTDDGSGWGYGNAPKSKEEFLCRLEGLTDALLNNSAMFGFCYTQLYDVEQEQNGIYTYERKEKFPTEQIYKIFSKKAKIEE